MKDIIKIKNIFGENLDLLVEGNENSQDLIIFVHGYGTDKNEGFASFLDFADYLREDYLMIRFDLSGYGESEGEDTEFQFQKAAGDLDSVIRYANKTFSNKNINIIAHSLGTFVVSILSPYGIKKAVFTSIVNSNTKFVSEQLQKRIISNGGKVDKNGITIYPRTSGVVQKMGKDFWRTLENFDPIEYIEDFGNKTELIIFKPLQDEVLPNQYFDEYKNIKNIRYQEVEGDHNFRDVSQRSKLFQSVKDFLSA